MEEEKVKNLNIRVSGGEIIEFMKLSYQYTPALRQVAEAKLIELEAEKRKISISKEELQRASDIFRITFNLRLASDMTHWLRATGLSIDNYVKFLRIRILTSKLSECLMAEAMSDPAFTSGGSHPTREQLLRRWLENISVEGS
jgi:hypothetical protein